MTPAFREAGTWCPPRSNQSELVEGGFTPRRRNGNGGVLGGIKAASCLPKDQVRREGHRGTATTSAAPNGEMIAEQMAARFCAWVTSWLQLSARDIVGCYSTPRQAHAGACYAKRRVDFWSECCC